MPYIRLTFVPYICLLSILLIAEGCGPKTPEQKQQIMIAALNSAEGQKALDKVVELMTKLRAREFHTETDEELLKSTESALKQKVLGAIEKMAEASEIRIRTKASYKKDYSTLSHVAGREGTDKELNELAEATVALYEVVFRDFIE